MDSDLTETLAREIIEFGHRLPLYSGQPSSAVRRTDNIACHHFATYTGRVVERLLKSPHTPAETLCRDLNMSLDEMKLTYKLIQTSATVKEMFTSSPNADYLNIVNHYFNKPMYVVVFFVGTSCPGRCIFCPNVSVREDGKRDLSVYRGNRDTMLSRESIVQILDDVSAMHEGPVSTLIKISGGLEPLTDPETMRMIMEEAQARQIRTKLFTNGLLLNTPELRRLSLQASDVRISLNTLTEKAFSQMVFGENNRPPGMGFPNLLTNIRNLVSDRRELGVNTRIGINTIILEENHRNIEGFVALASNLGVDYIDFKPNYFIPYQTRTERTITQTIARLRQHPEKYRTSVYFAGSLSSENVFWTHREGLCHPHKQSRFKLFITPFGQCSPVHHGAFPSPDGILDSRFTVGQITPGHTLNEILDNMPQLPDLAFDKLNPFEHMLALEIEREETDWAFGISPEYNPYNFQIAETLPEDIEGNVTANHLFPIQVQA
jgi:MoaA/NifB/PqqE/SkfB family radical SAM enzyme